MPHGWRDDPLIFLAIGTDGIVTIVVHRSEMGQGVRTGMPLIVADELEADWAQVRVSQAPADEDKYGNQDTDGSRSTRHFFEPMRRCRRGGANHARAGRCPQLGGAGQRSARRQPPGGASRPAVVPRAMARWRSGLRRLPVPPRDSLRLKSPAAVPLHRQGPDLPGGWLGYRDRQGAIRHRCARRGHVVRGHGALAGARRQDRQRRFDRGRKDPRCRQGGQARGQRTARPNFTRWPAWPSSLPTPGLRSRRATRSRFSGRTAPTVATIRARTARSWNRRRANRARYCARREISSAHSPVRRARSKRSTTCRIWRTPPWSRRRRWHASTTGAVKCGRPPRHPRQPGRMWPSTSA